MHCLAPLRNESESSFGQSRDSHQGHLLHIRAVVSSRFQAVLGELGRDVFGGEVPAALTGATPFQQVMG